MIRVMIIDDSMLARKSIQTALEEDPNIEIVGTAANGQEGLEKIDTLNPQVVTCDIEMPVMDGIQTLMKVRKLHPGIRVIMLSSLTQPDSKKEELCRSLGAHAVLAKPVEHSNIRAASNKAALLQQVADLGRAR